MTQQMKTLFRGYNGAVLKMDHYGVYHTNDFNGILNAIMSGLDSHDDLEKHNALEIFGIIKWSCIFEDL